MNILKITYYLILAFILGVILNIVYESYTGATPSLTAFVITFFIALTSVGVFVFLQHNSKKTNNEVLRQSLAAASLFSRFFIAGAISFLVYLIYIYQDKFDAFESLLLFFFELLILGPVIFIAGGIVGVFLSSFVLLVRKDISINQFYIEVGVTGLLIIVPTFNYHF